MIDLPENIKIETVPVEKRYKSVTAGLTRRIKILYEAIYEKYGKDGLELIRDVGNNYALEIAGRAKGKVIFNDLKSVALYIIRIFNTLRGNGKVVEFSNKRVVIRVFQCPYKWQGKDICEAHTQMEKKLVETLGTNLCYKITKSIPRGDAYCDHCIEFTQ